MAHSRVVHKEIWRSSRFLSVKDHGAQLLYCAMLNEADDFGNMEADSSQLWRWARDFLNLDSEKQIEPWLVKLSRVDLIALYQAHGKRYLHIQRWKNSRNYIANPTIPLSPWNDPQPRTGRGRLAAHAKIEQGQPLPQPDGNLAATLPAINGNGIDHETGEILNGNGSNHPIEPGEAINIEENQEHTTPIDGNLAADLPQPVVNVDKGVGVERSRSKDYEQTSSEENRPMERAKRLPKDWNLTDDLLRWALSFRKGLGKEVTAAQVAILATTFADYWHSVPGNKGTKLDWPATFRNWVTRTTDAEWQTMAARQAAPAADRPGARGI